MLVELLVCAKYLLYEPTDEDLYPTKLSFSAVQQALAEGGILYVALPLLLDPAARPTPGVCKGVCSLVSWLVNNLGSEEHEQLGMGALVQRCTEALVRMMGSSAAAEGREAALEGLQVRRCCCERV